MLLLLQAFLTGVVASPETPIYALPMLDTLAADALEAFIDTHMELDESATIQSLFEASADRFPKNACIVGSGETLTYQDVEHMANQMAHLLMRMGVGSDVAVGVMLERCPEMYIAMLAVLKAGGCYIPIDRSALTFPPLHVLRLVQLYAVWPGKTLHLTPSE